MYTKLKTWANGDIILAADVQGELDNVRDFISQVSTNEIESSRWIDTKHVMRGDFNAPTNTAQFCSGVYAGRQVLFDTAFTYGTTYNTLHATGTAGWEYMPLTSLTLEIRRPMSALMSWWATPITYDNQSAGAQGTTEIRLYIGNKTLRYAEPYKSLEETAATGAKEFRYFASGFHMVDYNAVGIYELGLVTQSTTSKTRLHSWGLSFEGFNF